MVSPFSSTSSMVSYLSMWAMMAVDLRPRCSRGRRSAARHRLVDDLQHAAAGEQLVFHQRDVGLDAGGVAIHEEADGAGGREHGDLRVAVAVLAGRSASARSQQSARLVLEVMRTRSLGWMSSTASRCSSMTSSMDSTLSLASGLSTPWRNGHRDSRGTAPMCAAISALCS